jgi:hypothetical protein
LTDPCVLALPFAAAVYLSKPVVDEFKRIVEESDIIA